MGRPAAAHGTSQFARPLDGRHGAAPGPCVICSGRKQEPDPGTAACMDRRELQSGDPSASPIPLAPAHGAAGSPLAPGPDGPASIRTTRVLAAQIPLPHVQGNAGPAHGRAVRRGVVRSRGTASSERQPAAQDVPPRHQRAGSDRLRPSPVRRYFSMTCPICRPLHAAQEAQTQRGWTRARPAPWRAQRRRQERVRSLCLAPRRCSSSTFILQVRWQAQQRCRTARERAPVSSPL